MAYYFSDARIANKLSIYSTASCASAGLAPFRPGTRIRGADPLLGSGDFIFLPTIASVTAGLLVRWVQSASGVITTTVVPNTASLQQPVAVAMAAGAASNYGWFCVEGTVPVKKSAAAIAPNVGLSISATTGRVFTQVASAGKAILGARASNSATVATATSTVTVTLQYPVMGH